MTETIVERGTDIESIEHLDFEHEEPCDYGKYGGPYGRCDNSPVWKVVVSCCGVVILFCQEHMDHTLDAIAKGLTITCICNVTHDPGSKAILSAEKLDKRSKV